MGGHVALKHQDVNWTPYAEMTRWRRRFWALLAVVVIGAVVLILSGRFKP